MTEGAKVWLLDQLSRNYASELRCQGRGLLEEKVTENAPRLCSGKRVGRTGEGSRQAMTS